MKEHQRYEENLSLYVAGQLGEMDRAEMDLHLGTCAECQADLALWEALSGEINAANRAVSAPPDLAERALTKVPRRWSLSGALRHVGQLLRSQVPLVQREMWPACAAVMALGVVVAILLPKQGQGIVYFLAPMVAAASLAVIFGPENDSATELTLATPTSAWKVLLARLTLVSAYNLLLALAASVFLLVFVPAELFWSIVLTWLGPMTFLSALALVLSLWIGTGNALLVVYGLWLVQYIPFRAMGIWVNLPAWVARLPDYQGFWHSPILLFALSVILLGVALLSANRSMRVLPQRMA